MSDWESLAELISACCSGVSSMRFGYPSRELYGAAYSSSSAVLAQNGCEFRRGHLATAATLSLRRREDYIQSAGKSAMAINVLWNKRDGPGGSARRLHHNLPFYSGVYGGETGSTCVVKA